MEAWGWDQREVEGKVYGETLSRFTDSKMPVWLECSKQGVQWWNESGGVGRRHILQGHLGVVERFGANSHGSYGRFKQRSDVVRFVSFPSHLPSLALFPSPSLFLHKITLSFCSIFRYMQAYKTFKYTYSYHMFTGIFNWEATRIPLKVKCQGRSALVK